MAWKSEEPREGPKAGGGQLMVVVVVVVMGMVVVVVGVAGVSGAPAVFSQISPR